MIKIVYTIKCVHDQNGKSHFVKGPVLVENEGTCKDCQEELPEFLNKLESAVTNQHRGFNPKLIFMIISFIVAIGIIIAGLSS